MVMDRIEQEERVEPGAGRAEPRTNAEALAALQAMVARPGRPGMRVGEMVNVAARAGLLESALVHSK